MRKRPNLLRRRLYKFLYGLETIIEAFFGSACRMGMVGRAPDGTGVSCIMWVRWWNPAAWLGWFRTVVLRDNQGSAYYRRIKTFTVGEKDGLVPAEERGEGGDS